MARKKVCGICVTILILGLLVTPSPVGAQQAGSGEDAVFYLGSGMLSLLHIPLKLVTCGTTQVLTTVAYVTTYGVPGNFEGGTNGRQIGEVARRSCVGGWAIPVDQVKADYQ